MKGTGWELDRDGLRVSKAMTGAQFAEMWQELLTVRDALALAIGDAYLYAVKQPWYGDSWSREAFSAYSQHTLRVYAAVSKMFPRSRRQQFGLTYSHYKEVYALPRADQERLLRRAVDNDWTKRELREQVLALKRRKQ